MSEGIDMHHVALRDLCRNARLHRAFENPAEALSPPPLSDPRQRGMVWQRLVKAIADKPPDPEVDLCLPHQATIVHDPEQEARKHQPDGDLRIDPRSPERGVTVFIELLKIAALPALSS